MNVPVLSELVDFIEGIFKHTAPTVVNAAAQAAAGAAVETAETDPKVQAITVGAVALLTAAQNLKTAINAAPPTPPAAPAQPAAPAS